MADLRKSGSTSNIVRFVLKNSTTGVGLTGLTSASTGLIISTIADNEATATVYTVAASNVETITTLGTFAAPTASKCRFKEVDATNHKGLYEFQFADARLAVASAKRLVISVTGATSLLDADYEIQLTQADVYDSVRLGLTALPNAAAGASGGLPLSVDASGRVDVLKINGTSQTARDIGASVLLAAGTGTGQLDFTSGVVKANATLFAGQTITAAAGVTLPSEVASPTNITAGTITTVSGNVNGTVASVTGSVGSVTGAVGSVTGSVGSVTGAVGSVTGNLGGNVVGSVNSVTTGVSLSAGAVQAIWDALTSALTTVGSIGKKLADWTIGTAQTGDSFARLGAPVGASISADIAGVQADTDNIQTRLPAALTGAGNIKADALVVSDKTGYALTTAPLDAAATRTAIGLASANLDTQIAAIQSDTDNIQTRLPAALVSGRIDASVGVMATDTVTAAALATDAVAEIQAGLSTLAAGAAMTLTTGERNAIADAMLVRALAAESYAAPGAVPTLSQALHMLLSDLGQFSISGTTLTCKKLDGTTTSMTFTLDSATAPTSRTRTT